MKLFRPSVGQTNAGNMMNKFVSLANRFTQRVLGSSILGAFCWIAVAPVNVAAAQTAECSMTVSNSDIDFGQLKRSLLTRAQQKVSIGQRSLNLTVNCANPTEMTLFYRAVASINQPGYTFGSAGNYQLKLRDATVDGQPVNLGRVSASGQMPSHSEPSLTWEGEQGITAVHNGSPVKGTSLRATLDVAASMSESQLRLRSATNWQSSGRLEIVPGGESRTLSLKASIQPVSCVPTLSQGGTVKLGKISQSDLSLNQASQLQPRSIELNVACEAPVSFAIKTIDNQQGTATRSGNEQFGLGLDNSANPIGSYTLSINSTTSHADSHSSLYLTQAPLSASTWSESATGSQQLSTDSLSGFTPAVASNAGPAPLEQLNTTLTVDVEIAPTGSLKVTDEIEIKGSATLEVFYI